MLLAKGSHWICLSTILVAGAIGWFLHPLLNDSTTESITEIPVEVAKSAPSESKLLAEWKDDIQPMLEHYCYDCHGDGKSKGELDLEEFPTLASMRKDPKIWEHILARVDYHLMPPPRKEQPDEEERRKLIGWINHAIFPADANDPGHIAMRRLNNIEYQNTIDDLLGVDTQVSSILPSDDSGYGFDNNGSALTISPAHIEKYLHAAEKALDQAIVLGPMKPRSMTFKSRDFKKDGVHRDGGRYLFRSGTTKLTVRAREAGKYLLKINASASQAGDEPAVLDVRIRGKHIAHFEVANLLGDEKTFTVDLNLPKGNTEVNFTFPNDFYDPKHKNPRRRDRNLMIHGAKLEGPLGRTRQKPASHRRIFTPRKSSQDNLAYASEVLTHFARKAFRRPVRDEEIDRYLALANRIGTAEKSLESGIKSAISAMLVSPSFLFIAPEASISRQTGNSVLISEHALASRLSYFLWSTMPDSELMALADRGQLRKNLDSQISRMLKDARFREMVRHFSGQWLQLRDLKSITPDPKRFRRFSRDLAHDMRSETERLTDHILRGDHSLLEFLDADYSFINDRLARHYKIPGIEGNHFRRVKMIDSKRRGILTHASVLTLTSQPDRTSPVLRGKFVLENILDITPPPPPPDLPALEEAHENGKKMTVREQLAMHRKKTACAGCHNLMDPVGLAFENYNAIGAWREFDNGRAVDASGKLVTGEPLNGAESLRLVLLNGKRDEFLRCISIKLMTYALGRGVDRQDRLHIDKILSELQEKEYGSHALIKGIIHSVPFQRQRQ